MKHFSIKRSLLLLSAVSLFLCAPTLSAFAQDAVAKKIIQEGTSNNLTQKHLDVLVNRIGGRPIGSDAYSAATLWAADQFRKWGYEVTLEEAGETRVGFSRGPWFGRILGAQLPNGEGHTLHFVTPSYTSGTKGVQKGHVLIEPKTQAEFDRMKGALKGAWVLVSGRSTGWPIARGEVADAKRDSLIALREAALKEAGYRRYADTLKSLPDEPALFYRQMVEAGVLGFIQSAPVPLTALWDKYTVNDPKSDFDNLPPVPDIKLDEHQFAVIHQMAKERRSFELEFDIRNNFRPGPVKYHNVVAKLKGTKHPEQAVIFSGHLDSYDVATGGVDCGVGVTPAMEAARLLSVAGAKTKQSVIFILFAGEEFGLLGANAWVKNHKNELGNISNLFNRDGGPTVPVGVSVPEAMYDDFVKATRYIHTINQDFGWEVRKAPTRKWPTSTGGTDASVFAIEGVPTISLNLADVKGYNFDYREIWHTERDTYTKSINEYQEHTSIVLAILAYELANMDHILSREGMYFPKEK